MLSTSFSLEDLREFTEKIRGNVKPLYIWTDWSDFGYRRVVSCPECSHDFGSLGLNEDNDDLWKSWPHIKYFIIDFEDEEKIVISEVYYLSCDCGYEYVEISFSPQRTYSKLK